MGLPKLRVADHERMSAVRANALDPCPQVEAVAAVAVRLVVLEADERQGADIDLLAAAVGLLHREGDCGGPTDDGCGVEAIAVVVVLAGDVACERVEAVG